MPKKLTNDQIAAFHEQGFLAPLDLCGEAEAAALYRNFAALEDASDGDVANRFRIKAHLPFPWLCELIRHPALLDAAEDILGPNILCWGSTFFIKRPGDERFISWHTDTFFYGTRPNHTLNAWVSFNESDLVSGCLRYLPGSHKGPPAEHVIRPDPKNLASNGQTVVGVDETKAVDAILKPGQFSLHHESVVHGSSPNRSDHARVGLSIHYIPPYVRETAFEGATAMLLRGEDADGNWLPDPEPARDFDPDCIAFMDTTYAKFRRATREKISAGGKS